MQPVWIFRHIECEGPGSLGPILDRHNVPYKVIAIDQQDAIPESTKGTAALVFMGGPMSVNDDDAWIKQEIHLIRQAYKQDLPMLGHCLGAQLISKALGASVYPNSVKEIGWLPVQTVEAIHDEPLLQPLAGEFDVFHWHGETFDLPDGAVRILQSKNCKNQAYILGRILAMQFHVEVTEDMVKQWIALYRDEITVTSSSIQNENQMLDQITARTRQLSSLSEVFYNYWLSSNKLI